MVCEPPHSNGPERTELPEKESRKLRRRRRPLTKGLRTELRILIENAILDSNSALLSSAFSPCQSDADDGTLVAPLSVILVHLQQIGHNVARFSVLSNFALKSITNWTRIFAIEESPQQKQLLVKMHPHIRLHNDEKTVFVDNLPPLCTAERLRKRAAFFGRVVGLRMPQIGRIQRRIAQMIGGVWPTHSGFAFVQFASKTAAKRFCKRYALNSRLKRIHHHGHKHGKKRAMTTTAKDVQQQHSDEKAQQQQVNGAGGEGTDNNQTALLSPCSLAAESVASVVVEPAHYPPPVGPPLQTVVSNPNNSNGSLWSGGNVDVRFRCNSVAEESVMSESGNETDAQMDKMRGDGNRTGATGESRRGEGEGNSNRKRKRRRRPIVGHCPPVTQQQTLNSLFRHIQVFPLKQYRELRTDYLRIKKTRMGTLKKQLLGMARNGEEKHPPEMDDDQSGETEEERKGTNREIKGEPEKRRRTRRGRKRGIRKLLGRAEHAKVAEHAKDDGNADVRRGLEI